MGERRQAKYRGKQETNGAHRIGERISKLQQMERVRMYARQMNT